MYLDTPTPAYSCTFTVAAAVTAVGDGAAGARARLPAASGELVDRAKLVEEGRGVDDGHEV